MWYPFKYYKKKPISWFFLICYIVTFVAILFYLYSYLSTFDISFFDFIQTPIFKNLIIVVVVIGYLIVDYILSRKRKK